MPLPALAVAPANSIPLRAALPACRDVVTDTVHQFAPAYHDYVLYSDGTRKAATPPKTVRTRTFVAGAQGGLWQAEVLGWQVEPHYSSKLACQPAQPTPTWVWIRR